MNTFHIESLVNEVATGGTAGLLQVVTWIFLVVAVLIVPFAIWLGFRLAKAGDPNARREAKKHMVNAVASLIIILILIGALQIPGIFFDPPDDTGGQHGWLLTPNVVQAGVTVPLVLTRNGVLVSDAEFTVVSGNGTVNGSNFTAGNSQSVVRIRATVPGQSIPLMDIIVTNETIDGPDTVNPPPPSGPPPALQDGEFFFPVRLRNPSGAMLSPSSIITSGFQTSSRPDHNGIDLQSNGWAVNTPCPWGRPGPVAGDNGAQFIFAIADGIVRRAVDNNATAGTWITLEHSDGAGGVFFTRYIHLSVRYVGYGESVEAGQIIGRMGNTAAEGSSNGHLHFEVGTGTLVSEPANLHRVNPLGTGVAWWNPIWIDRTVTADTAASQSDRGVLSVGPAFLVGSVGFGPMLANTFAEDLMQVVTWIFLVVATLIVPLAIWLGFKLAKAGDPNKRREAKKHMINAIASLIIILILIGAIQIPALWANIGDGGGSGGGGGGGGGSGAGWTMHPNVMQTGQSFPLTITHGNVVVEGATFTVVSGGGTISGNMFTAPSSESVVEISISVPGQRVPNQRIVITREDVSLPPVDGNGGVGGGINQGTGGPPADAVGGPAGTALGPGFNPNDFLLNMTSSDNCKLTASYIISNIVAGRNAFTSPPSSGSARLSSGGDLTRRLNELGTNTTSGRSYSLVTHDADSHAGSLNRMLNAVYDSVVTNGTPIAVITPGSNQHWEVVYAVSLDANNNITHVHVINPGHSNWGGTRLRTIPVNMLGAAAGSATQNSTATRTRFGIIQVTP